MLALPQKDDCFSFVLECYTNLFFKMPSLLAFSVAHPQEQITHTLPLFVISSQNVLFFSHFYTRINGKVNFHYHTKGDPSISSQKTCFQPFTCSCPQKCRSSPSCPLGHKWSLNLFCVFSSHCFRLHSLLGSIALYFP